MNIIPKWIRIFSAQDVAEPLSKITFTNDWILGDTREEKRVWKISATEAMFVVLSFGPPDQLQRIRSLLLPEDRNIRDLFSDSTRPLSSETETICRFGFTKQQKELVAAGSGILVDVWSRVSRHGGYDARTVLFKVEGDNFPDD